MRTAILALLLLLSPNVGWAQEPVAVAVPEIPAWRNVSVTEGSTTLRLAGFTMEEIRGLFELRLLTLQLRDRVSLMAQAEARSRELIAATERELDARVAQRALDARRIESLEAQIDAALVDRAQAERKAARRRVVPWLLAAGSAAVALGLGVAVAVIQ